MKASSIRRDRGRALGALATSASRVWRVGIPSESTRDSFPGTRKAMAALGYVEGKNIRYEFRYAEGDRDRLQAFASEWKVGVRPVTVRVISREKAVRAVASMRSRSLLAAYIPFSAGFFDDKASIARLGLENRVAMVDPYPGLARVGGLLTFSALMDDTDRQMAQQPDKILRGAPVRKIPFMLPTRYWFTINRKTATTLGLTIPTELLLRAEKVFE